MKIDYLGPDSLDILTKGINTKAALKADKVHKHSTSDITGLDQALENASKIKSVNGKTGAVKVAEVPSGGKKGQVLKKTTTSYGWEDDVDLSPYAKTSDLDKRLGSPNDNKHIENTENVWAAIGEIAAKGGDPELMEVLKQNFLKAIEELETVYGAGGKWALSADAKDRATITYESLERIKVLARGIGASMTNTVNILQRLNIGYDGEKIEDFDDLIKKVPATNIQAFALRTPGGHELIKGDWNCGFLGEVTAEEFGAFDSGSQAGKLLTPETYAAQVELTEGTALQDFNDKMVFLKVALDGEIIYISKYPIRYSLDWICLAKANIVFGRRIESIGGVNYRLTIPRGCNAECVSSNKDDEMITASPYNRVFVDLLSDEYNDADLGMNHPMYYGGKTWCQETMLTTNNSSADGSDRVLRGDKNNIAYFAENRANINFYQNGLRPVLRYVP